MKLTNKSVLVLMASAMLMAACSKEEISNQPAQSNSTSEVAKGPQVTIGFNIEAGLSNELRALGNLKDVNGRLRPNVSDNKVKIIVLVGSTTDTSIPLSIQEVDFTYIPESRSLRYRGALSVDARLVSGTAKNGLKMMLIAAPNGSYTANTKKINMQARLATRASMESTSGGFTVPYFSDWKDISGSVVNDNIDLLSDERPDENKIILKPQGQVIRMDIQDSQRLISGTMVNKVIFESNIMSRQGDYTLPANASSAPTWTPDAAFDATSKFDANWNHPRQSSVFRYDIPVTESVFTSVQTYYTWAEARPGVNNPYTRTYLQVKVPNPILTTAYTGTGAWWNGASGERRVVVDYSTNNLTASGSTLSLNYGKEQAATTVSRIPATYAAYVSQNSGMPAANTLPLRIQAFRNREYRNHTRYSWQTLSNNSWMGSNAQPITFTDSPNGTDNGKEWRIPTAEELSCIVPTEQNGADINSWFRLATNNSGDVGNYNREKAVIGSKGSAVKQYGALYYRLANASTLYAVRFMGIHSGQGGHDPAMQVTHNRHATFFKYNLLNGSNPSNAAIQVQAVYVGEHFPDLVNSRNQVKDFATFFAQFLTPDERILPLSGNDTELSIWVNAPVANNTGQKRYKWSITDGSATTVDVPASELSSRNASVVLIRDL